MAGRRLGPSIYTAGPIIDGNPPIWPRSDVIESAQQAEELVRRQKAAGYDFLKIYNRLNKEAYDAIATAAKQNGIAFAGHVPESVGLTNALNSGQRSIEHLDYYYEAVRSANGRAPAGRSAIVEHFSWASVDDAKIGRVASQTREAGVWNCPTLVVLQKWTTAEGMKEMLSRPEMSYVAPATLEFWSPARNYLARMSPVDIKVVHTGDTARKRMVKALHDAGAGLLLGTDTGNPFVVPGFSLHEELANFVVAGLTPYQALRAGTYDAADFMHAADEWGVVAEGRRADLVLLDADPFDDVTHARSISGVMIRGRWLPLSKLKELLDETAAKHRETKLAQLRKAVN
jgi:imidazolonepropionase-like amidohydrolase